MMLIPQTGPSVILTESVQKDLNYGGLRIVHAQRDPAALAAFQQGAYEFQNPMAAYTKLKATVAKKGYVGPTGKQRLVVTVHPNLQCFVDMVMYDPSNPPPNDYHALGMQQMHERTQSDFKGQKEANKRDFIEYLIEGIRGERPLFLPTISGWQSSEVFEKTVFFCLEEDPQNSPNVLYGIVFLPKAPIMQADGQTQTAALFGVAKSKDAIDAGALKNLMVTLEIELNVEVRSAAQSFADRNGRGSKKNKNLVISFDTSSALSELRVLAVTGTVFEDRIASGKNSPTSEKATDYIVDLSTVEQMLLFVISDGRLKSEHFKRMHVSVFLPYAQEFFKLLSDSFGVHWAKKTPQGSDPFRKLYVHGWPFALKALAVAYHRARLDKLGPLHAAIGAKDAGKTVEEAFKDKIAVEQQRVGVYVPAITYDELKSRLQKIDWLRYRKHWVALTSAKLGKDGKPKKTKLVSVGGERVLGQAQNTATIIASVAAKILSNSWSDLTSNEDAS